MVVHLWHSLIVVLMALSLIMGCASSPYVGTGAAVGGGLGAITGAALARNHWAGALIGGAVGTGLGAVGGYALQQRQTQQQGPPPQGYYQQSPSQGYGAPAPGYGYNGSPQGQAYGGSYGGYNTPNPVTPQGGPQYSAAPPEYGQPSSVHTPIRPAPYNTYE